MEAGAKIAKENYRWHKMGISKKKDENGIVVRNRARLVAQGYMQEEGIEYDEIFSLVARLKAI